MVRSEIERISYKKIDCIALFFPVVGVCFEFKYMKSWLISGLERRPQALGVKIKKNATSARYLRSPRHEVMLSEVKFLTIACEFDSHRWVSCSWPCTKIKLSSFWRCASAKSDG